MRKKLITAVLVGPGATSRRSSRSDDGDRTVPGRHHSVQPRHDPPHGQLLTVFTATANPAGGFVFSTHTQPQGIRGVDLQTGTAYLGTGLTRDLIFLSASGTSTFTFINRFHIQATAGEQSFDVSETLHITALADGTVTAFVDNFSAAC
jgi:hypothetical protein